MSMPFTIFLYCLFSVSFFLTYLLLYILLYILYYKIFRIQRRLGNTRLVLWLIIASWIMAPLLFSHLLDIAAYFILL